MIHKFTIDGILPGLNDFIAKSTYNRFAYGAFKKQWTEFCAWSAKAQGVPVIAVPIKIEVNWIEKNRRRDLSNISGGGMKVLEDGLVIAGIIPNDTRKWITGFSHYFPEPDPKNPRVEVSLIESQQ